MSRKSSQDSATSQWRYWFFLALATGFSFAIPSAGFAQNWQFQPTISLTADYDDNIRLDNEGQPDDSGQGEVTGGVLSAGMRISRQSPTGVVRFRPLIRSSHYGTDADSDDYSLDAFFGHTGQKSEWAFEARYSSEEVLTAELDDPDFDDPDIDSPVIDDSGITIRGQRDRVVLAPRVEFDLSERTTLQFQGQFVDTSYDGVAAAFADYSNSYYGGTLSRALSEKNTLRISVFGRNYDPDIVGSKSESVGSFTTFEHRFSARNSVFVHAGYENVDISQLLGTQVINRSEGSLVFGAGARRQFKISRIVVDVRHSVTPSGIAELRERSQFRVKFVRDLSELTKVTVVARYHETNSLSEVTFSPDRDFAQVELNFERVLDRAWSIIGGYSYTQQEFSDVSNVETSNALFLGVRYSPQGQR